MEFKDKLKKLREERGLSQQALADHIFVSRSAVAKWENGFGFPSQDSCDALTAYFGVDGDYFRTEEPESVIVRKNTHIRALRYVLAAAAIIFAILIMAVCYHWFSTVRSTNIKGMENRAADYLGYDTLEIIKTTQRGNYLAALCTDSENSFSLCVFEKDPLFNDRWYANGGKNMLSAGKLSSWNYGSPENEAVLIFCGGELSEEIKWYYFSNDGISYTCPVKDNMVLDIFIIPDSSNINGCPTPLDENREPLLTNESDG